MEVSLPSRAGPFFSWFPTPLNVVEKTLPGWKASFLLLNGELLFSHSPFMGLPPLLLRSVPRGLAPQPLDFRRVPPSPSLLVCFSFLFLNSMGHNLCLVFHFFLLCCRKPSELIPASNLCPSCLAEVFTSPSVEAVGLNPPPMFFLSPNCPGFESTQVMNDFFFLSPPLSLRDWTCPFSF